MQFWYYFHSLNEDSSIEYMKHIQYDEDTQQNIYAGSVMESKSTGDLRMQRIFR